MAVTLPVAEFKTFFDRDFVYGTDIDTVRDSDIEKSISEAQAVFNNDLYPETSAAELAFKYLVAHFLVQDLNAADTGGQSVFMQSSRSAGGISASLEIPEWMKSGEMGFYATTYYGQKFLMLSKPYVDGAVFTVAGRTNF